MEKVSSVIIVQVHSTEDELKPKTMLHKEATSFPRLFQRGWQGSVLYNSTPSDITLTFPRGTYIYLPTDISQQRRKNDVREKNEGNYSPRAYHGFIQLEVGQSDGIPIFVETLHELFNRYWRTYLQG